MLGDTELIEKTAQALYDHPRFPRYSIDILVCPEAKPYAHPRPRQTPSSQLYRGEEVPEVLHEQSGRGKTTSITTAGEQLLVLDGPDVESIRGRNVCIVDDVVSTGGSITRWRSFWRRWAARS